jgi:hypothetical protein
MQRGYTACALLCAMMLASSSASAGGRSIFATGRGLFDTAFDPRRNFAGDIVPSSDDEMILTIAASGRDDYAPAYSLAIAQLCKPIEGGCRRYYAARVLRVAADREQWFDRGLALVDRVHRARGAGEVETVLEDSNLEWLEADAAACEGVIAAIGAVRDADWRPDLPASLTPQGEGDLVLHPAMIRVEMWGFNVRARYRGWLLGEGLPAAARQLIERLEPCWRPSRTKPPWRRRANGRPG